MTINYLNNSGQDRVQAGNNSGRMLGMFASNIMGFNNARTQLEARKHMVTHQTDESIRRDREAQRHKAIYGAAGRAANAKVAMDADRDYFSEATKKGEDGKHINEAWAAHIDAGVTKMPSGTSFSPQAGVKRTQMKQEYEQNHPTPKREPAAPKPPKPPKAKFGDEGFGGYTPRKTGTGGYDQALKAGKITKAEHSAYMEDAAAGPKNYMPTQASTAVNELVKERQDAEANRNTHLNDGLDEGKK